MTISPGMLFFTPQIGAGNGAAPGLPGQAQALSGGNGIFSTQVGMEFFNLLFATPANGEPKIEGAKSDSDISILPLLLAHKVAKIQEPPVTDSTATDETMETTVADTPAVDGDPVALEAIPADVLEQAGTPDISPLAETVADLLTPAPETAAEATTPETATTAPETTTTPPALPEIKGRGLALGKMFAFLQHLLAGLPEENRPQVFNIASSKSIKGANPLQFTLPSDAGTETPPETTGTQAADTPADTTQTPPATPALIATGLTPEGITKFLDELMKRAQAGEGFIVGLVKLLPPQAKNDAIFFPRALILPAAPKTQPDNTQNTNTTGTPPAVDGTENLAAELNALTIGEDGEVTPNADKPEPAGFEKILKVLEQAQQPRADAATPAPQATDNTKPPAAPAPSPALSTVKVHALPALGMEFSSGAASDVYPDGLDWAQSSSTSAAPGLTVSGPGPMTSLINHATQATQSHPAVQVIAATITKAAGDGQGKNFTLKLEPPELGRIEVRMEFSKDKSLKTHMLVEKQETYLMLQRDAQVLERTLQNAGIDIDGGMSFELAQDGGMFGQNDGQGGSNDSGGGSAGAEDDNIETIESTMTWTVDGAGQTHYDIWA